MESEDFKPLFTLNANCEMAHVDKRGYPIVTPMFYVIHDGFLQMSSIHEARAAQRLQRLPHGVGGLQAPVHPQRELRDGSRRQAGLSDRDADVLCHPRRLPADEQHPRSSSSSTSPTITPWSRRTSSPCSPSTRTARWLTSTSGAIRS